MILMATYVRQYNSKQLKIINQSFLMDFKYFGLKHDYYIFALNINLSLLDKNVFSAPVCNDYQLLVLICMEINCCDLNII